MNNFSAVDILNQVAGTDFAKFGDCLQYWLYY